MQAVDDSFPQHCCELLAGTVGPCIARRMFGGWSITTGGMAIAMVANLGSGDRLWLKADGIVRSHYEAAGSQRFTYLAKGVERSINYYSVPDEAMESPQLMAPWARQALDCALKAQSAKVSRPRPVTRSSARPARPATSLPRAPAPRATASRKSAKG